MGIDDLTMANLAACLDDDPAAVGLRLIVLHGSRARGDDGPHSDWDLAVQGDSAPDLLLLAATLASALGTDRVDVVDLARASALLRYRAARDGVVLLERPAGAFEQFQLAATLFWCDAGEVIRRAQADVLAAAG